MCVCVCVHGRWSEGRVEPFCSVDPGPVIPELELELEVVFEVVLTTVSL